MITEEQHKKQYRYQKLFGHISVDIVPKNVRIRKNKEKSWKYGHNEEFDFICISKDGTLGDIYVLQNLAIGLPAEPKDKTIIKSHDKPVLKQYWERDIFPVELLSIEYETIDWNSRRENRLNPKTPSELFYMKPKSFIDKHQPLIDKDFEKREFGFWQMINGKAFWIPPSHYFMLQHIPVHGKTYPDYRFTNRDYYLFWEGCLADNRCLGMDYMKNRRSGASTMSGSEDLNIGTQAEEALIGIMSKTNRDSVSYLNKMVIRPFKKLPWWIKPQTSGTTSATSGLNFRDVAKKISAKNTAMVAEEGLDTSIHQFSTSLNSMDGEKVLKMTLDEFGKYPPDVPADAYWAVAEECLTEGFKIVGKVMAISTVNAQAKGGKAYKDIYYASDVRNRMENGRTASGMYSFFIPAEWNQEGGYDLWGFSITEDPIHPIKNRDGDFVKQGNLSRLIEKGKALKMQSAVLYNEFLRKHPRTEGHAFRDEASASDFDLNLINEQMDYNEMFYKSGKRDDLAHEFYERGNYVDNPTADGTHNIEWIPSKYGRFFCSWMPPKELRNNFKIVAGEYYPLNDFGCIGVDTYKFSKTVDKRGSLGAIHGSTGNSVNLDIFPDNKFFIEYIYRPDSIEMFMTDAINCMLFNGIPGFIETNVPNLVEKMKREGMTRFSLRRKDKKKLSESERELGGIAMSGEMVLQNHYFALQTYIKKFVGEAMDSKYRDVGQIGDCPFNRTLDSWTKFNPNNRTTQDASISSGLSRMGINTMFQNNLRNNNSKIKDLFKGMFQEYDYSKGNLPS